MSNLGLTGKISASKQYEWKIGNFFSLCATRRFYYESPSFTLGNTSWHLRIYPAGDSMAKPENLSVFLVNESNISRHVTFAFYIKKADGTLIKCGRANVHIIDSIGYGNFYERSVLQKNESELVPSGNLTILCNLKLNQDEKQATIKTEKIENVHEKQANGAVNVDNKIFAGNL